MTTGSVHNRQKGETGAVLPRQLSKQYGRAVCNLHNNGGSKAWLPYERFPTLFRVPDPDAMVGVEVVRVRKRQISRPPS